MSEFDVALDRATKRVRCQFDELLAQPDGPENVLFEAMRYITMEGGKGFRPLLCFTTAALFECDEKRVVRVSTAIEAVHCYSLIHDDLPSMDNDPVRRGRPSVHIAFDEATAILAGDALLTLAFEVLANEATHPSGEIRLDLVAGLARAAGMHGMVGGQMIDMLSPDLQLDASGLTRLQKMKTGALISYAVEAGALLGKADNTQRHALAGFAHDIGLAFQIVDDVLDAQGTSARTGKTHGKDAAHGKVTFASLLGIGRARDQARLLIDQAVNHLDIFGSEADVLRQAAIFAISRNS